MISKSIINTLKEWAPELFATPFSSQAVDQMRLKDAEALHDIHINGVSNGSCKKVIVSQKGKKFFQPPFRDSRGRVHIRIYLEERIIQGQTPWVDILLTE